MNTNFDLTFIVNAVRDEVERRIEKMGLFYRVFARGKTINSMAHKLSIKHYGGEKKVQDIIGVRIVLYFIDDVNVVYSLLKSSPNFVDESNSEIDIKLLDETEHLSIGKLADKLFMPQRLNLVFRLNEELTNDLAMALHEYDNHHLVDNTYEVQIRTIFSEGWHEVEHDLRYKCKDEDMWNYCKEESRTLNGIYASLETTESSMRSVFDSMAYKNFRKRDWTAMMRNKLCIRFDDNQLSGNLCQLMDKNDAQLGKEVFRFPRAELFPALQKLPGRLPRKMDNLVFLINRLTCHREDVLLLEPEPISELLEILG